MLTRYQRLYESSIEKIMEEVNPQLKGNFKVVLEKLSEYGFESIAKLAGISEENYKFLLTFLSKNWDKLKTRSEGEISHDLVEPLKAFLKKNPPLALKNLSLETLNQYKGIKKEVDSGEKGWKVIEIDDVDTCVRLSQGSGWCVKDEAYAEDYLRDGLLYMILKDGKRFALLSFATDNYMDVYDNPLSYDAVQLIRKNIPLIDELFSDPSHLTTYSTNKDIHNYLEQIADNYGSFGKTQINDDLDLSYSRIESLPEDFRVTGDLYLSNTKISVLPKKLYVGKDLDLRNTGVSELPPDLYVGGNLHLDGTKVDENHFVKPQGVMGTVFF